MYGKNGFATKREEATMSGWIGVDLDGSLAYYDGWKGPDHIGDPIPLMADRVKEWLAEGQEVRVVTARMADPKTAVIFCEAFAKWSREHFGVVLPATASKDFAMVALYDDRAYRLQENTGVIL